MKVIKTYSIGRLHELAVDYVKKTGEEVVTEDNELTLQAEPVCLYTGTPMDGYRVSRYSIHKHAFMERYTKDLLDGCDSEFSYTYHDRLFNNPNQIEYIIEKLRAHPNSRRAVAHTWNALTDESMQNCPCLQYLQCTVYEDLLNMYVLFRSNDILSAFGANAYALTMLQKHIADQLDYDVGSYTHVAIVPHIYHIRDKLELEKMLCR